MVSTYRYGVGFVGLCPTGGPMERIGMSVAEGNVVELRVHGVGGPTAGTVLETLDPIPIGGAEGALAGFYEREEPGPSGQDVEAFVWGGLTSRSAIQAAWWLLLPFSLVNMAGWMIRAGVREGDDGQEKTGRSVVWWIRFLVTAAGVLLTVLYLLWSAVVVMDVVAYQCGGQTLCVDRSWLLPLRWLGGHPLWRISIGAFIVLAVHTVLLFAARLSHERYERFELGEEGKTLTQSRSLWKRNDNLKSPSFWYNWKEWSRLFYLHAYVGIALIAGIVGYSLTIANHQSAFAAQEGWLPSRSWSIVLATLGLLATAWMMRPNREPESGGEARSSRQFGWRFMGVATAVLATAGISGLAGWQFYWQVDGRATQLEGGLGLAHAIAAFFVAEIVILVIGAVLVAINFKDHFHLQRFFSVTPPVNDGFRLLPPLVAAVTGFAIAGAGFGAATLRLMN